MGAPGRAAHSRAVAIALMAGTACSLGGCLLRAKPGEAPLIGSIHIVGNKHVSSKDIIDRLALTTSGWRFIIKFGDAYPFDPEMLRESRKRIARIYQAFGYYDAQVTDVSTALDRGRINIRFRVVEGPPTRVASVAFTGLQAVPASVEKKALRRLPIPPGAVLTEDGYADLKKAIADRLKDAGYWQTAVTGKVVVDRAHRTGALHLTVKTGPRYRIAGIEVTGNKDVSPRRVREASRLHPGDFLSPAALAVAQRDVQAMGVFASVEVKPSAFDPLSAQAVVTIKAVDAPFQVIQAGAGVDIDQTRQMARVKAVYTDKNLAHDLQKIIAGGSVGYAFVPTLAAFFGPVGTWRESGIVADLQLQYVQPRALHLPIDFTTGVDYSKDLEVAFGYQRVGGHVGIIYSPPQVKGLTIAPSLNYDYYFDVTSGVPQPTVAGQPATAFATSGCGPNEQNQVTPNCTIGDVQLQINYDQRDDPLFTRKGYFLAISTEYASHAVSDFNFIQFSPEARVFLPVPFTRNFTLAARLQYGLLAQLGSGRAPPGVARFFAGGANSDRATSAEELGPREFIVLPNTGSGAKYIAGAPIPVGGDHLLEGNVELRWYSPVKGLVFAAFFDIARLQLLYNPPGQTAVPDTSGGFQYGPGIGVRYYSPFGPIRLDFAYRVSTLDTLPVGVDTTNVKNPSAAGVPTSVLSSSGAPNYRINTTCQTLPGQQSYQCYQDNRFQFFITLGEAF